ncbi:cupin domain-containing protein [Winogradskyella sp. R77965]|uniref:cupin domain-containing protein n=1 Tax=Winogradskyella sp. R77965 TaxID=3093872 RepID=UPI0037DD426A
MKTSKENSEYYNWGNNCKGWHLAKSENLSIIEELMPANTSEQRHYHNFSEQYFYVLKGTATFEIENKILEVNKGEGIHVHPQVVHQIKNEKSADLEFIVISQPTTKGDRINQPFENKELNLNGKKFKSVSSTNNGEVSSSTLFKYRQKRNIIWATYEGGEILFGTLSGRIEKDNLIFTYQHQNKNGDFKTGKCKSIIEIKDEVLILKEKWEWTCDDYSKGESTLKEIK